MFIDTHGHLNFNAFKNDRDDVIRRTLDGGVFVLMPGTQYTTSKRAIETAEQHEGLYAAIGLHPIHIGEQRHVDVWEVESEDKEEEGWMTFKTRNEEFDIQQYRELAQSKKTVAVGEVGLDYYYFPKSKTKRQDLKEKQEHVLRQQIDLALEFNLPVIFHCRVAHEDLISLLGEIQATEQGKLRGVVHSYTGDVEQAKRFADLGMMFGFNGLIFKDVPALPNPAEVIDSIPIEQIVLETDSPYLKPPHAEGDRNEPLNVRLVGEFVAEAKQLDLEEVAKQTTENAKNLFAI